MHILVLYHLPLEFGLFDLTKRYGKAAKNRNFGFKAKLLKLLQT